MGGILALDLGTQSVRALLFDARGHLQARSQVKFQPIYHSPHPGWAEQDADYYWSCLGQACRELWAQGVDPAKVEGVALTTQRGTTVAVDHQGRPLMPAITWLDQREAVHLPALPLWLQGLFSVVGEAETIDYFRRQAECNWIAQNHPDIWASTHKFLLISGYLNFRLCGRYVDSLASQVGYLPFDFKRLDWVKAWDWKWKALAVRQDQLPELLPPGAIMGQIGADASRMTGLPEGTPLVSAGADKACEVLGSGCLSPDLGALSFGTTATINTTQSRYMEATPLLPPYPAAVPGAFLTEVQTFRGFWMVNWFKEEFGHKEQWQAESEGLVVETLFDALLRETPPGAMGLMLQPYWSPGIREPGREAKGALIGFGDVHTRAHVYRAIIEGLAYALQDGRDRIEKRSRHRLRALRVSGGGAQSDEVMRITANVFGLPAERPHTTETSGLGAAMNVAVALGWYASHAEAVAAMTRVTDVFYPQDEQHRLYQQLYKRVWKRMYRQLRPIYQEIRQITGYPR
ncbi:MAG: carbohydrate kinase [Pseudomonadales bacterium]|nr:carbohydrate kinase [Pseudomonadales bacterium]